MLRSLINHNYLFRFSFRPEQNLRYFIVNYQLSDDFERSYEILKEKHKQYTQDCEDQGHLIYGALKQKNEGMVMIFFTKDERIPFDYIKQDPLFKEKLVMHYKLEEIELRTKSQSTELAQLLKYR